MKDRTRDIAAPVSLTGIGLTGGLATGFVFGLVPGLVVLLLSLIMATAAQLVPRFLTYLEVRARDRSAASLARAALEKGVELDITARESAGVFEIHVRASE